MKYKCIVLDHDDTVVDSTKQIHYPSFLGYLKTIRPTSSISYEEYMHANFHPGFVAMCREMFNFTDQEMDGEVVFWKNYLKEHVPEAYQGFKDLLTRFKAQGGIIAVVSHSFAENILRDYRANNLPEPDIIYGWERPEKERKPYPFPLYQIMRKYHLKRSEILMVDDLKPGFDMAKKCGVDFAAAGWAYELPEIKSFMTANSDFYLQRVEELEKVIF